VDTYSIKAGAGVGEMHLLRQLSSPSEDLGHLRLATFGEVTGTGDTLVAAEIGTRVTVPRAVSRAPRGEGSLAFPETPLEDKWD